MIASGVDEERWRMPVITPFVHHRHAVAFSDDLLDVAADHDDRRSILSEPANEAMDLGLGADVDALRRFVEDHDARRERQPFAKHDLLLVSAAECRDRRFDGRGFDRQRCGGVLSSTGLGGTLHETKTGVGAECRQRHVLAHSHCRDDAPAATILGNQTDSRADRVARRVERQRLAVEQYATGHRRHDSADRFGQLGASRADQAGNAEHLAAVDGQRDLGEWDSDACGCGRAAAVPRVSACFHRLARRFRRRSRGRPSAARDDRA